MKRRLPAAPLHRRLRPLRQRLAGPHRPGRASAGASLLVELIIASVIVITAFAMATSLSNSAVISTTRGASVADRERTVNADIAMLRDLAALYTFCDGQGTTLPSGSSCRKQGNPDTDHLSEDYYYPDNPSSSSENSEQIAFRTACEEAGPSLTAALITKMEASTTYAEQLSTLGISREISLDDDGGAAAHRLRIRYTGPKIDRTVLITPTVAAWCP